jgi:hypothetical protein
MSGMTAPTRDWRKWHARYDDPASSLSRRLTVVRRRVDGLLADGHVRTILSLCAGDGRDLIPVLAECPPELRARATIVELDPTLAATARRQAAEASLDMAVMVGDAGLTDTWREVPPVDLLMLCGIFGNVSQDDIHAAVDATPALLTPGGAVIWTRGHRGDAADLRPRIRQWFAEAGLEEVAYDEEEVGYGVGVHRVTARAAVGAMPERLFSFVP